MKEGKKHRKPKKSLEAGTPESQKETDTGAKRRKPKQNGENAPQNRRGRKSQRRSRRSSMTCLIQEPLKKFQLNQSVRVIYTSDGRYVKIVEVLPINFLHRSASEQRNIIYSYIGYLKIAPRNYR